MLVWSDDDFFPLLTTPPPSSSSSSQPLYHVKLSPTIIHNPIKEHEIHAGRSALHSRLAGPFPHSINGGRTVRVVLSLTVARLHIRLCNSLKFPRQGVDGGKGNSHHHPIIIIIIINSRWLYSTVGTDVVMLSQTTKCGILIIRISYSGLRHIVSR